MSRESTAPERVYPTDLDVSLIRLNQSSVDWVPAAGLVIFMPKHEWPPKGAAGWADWRLRYQITKTIESGRFTGEAGEMVLIPSHHYLTASWVVLVGSGEAPVGKPVLTTEVIEKAWSSISSMKFAHVAVALPGQISFAMATELSKMLIFGAGPHRSATTQLSILVDLEDERIAAMLDDLRCFEEDFEFKLGPYLRPATDEAPVQVQSLET